MMFSKLSRWVFIAVLFCTSTLWAAAPTWYGDFDYFSNDSSTYYIGFASGASQAQVKSDAFDRLLESVDNQSLKQYILKSPDLKLQLGFKNDDGWYYVAIGVSKQTVQRQLADQASLLIRERDLLVKQWSVVNKGSQIDDILVVLNLILEKNQSIQSLFELIPSEMMENQSNTFGINEAIESVKTRLSSIKLVVLGGQNQVVQFGESLPKALSFQVLYQGKAQSNITVSCKHSQWIPGVESKTDKKGVVKLIPSQVYGQNGQNQFDCGVDFFHDFLVLKTTFNSVDSLNVSRSRNQVPYRVSSSPMRVSLSSTLPSEMTLFFKEQLSGLGFNVVEADGDSNAIPRLMVSSQEEFNSIDQSSNSAKVEVRIEYEIQLAKNTQSMVVGSIMGQGSGNTHEQALTQAHKNAKWDLRDIVSIGIPFLMNNGGDL